MSDIFDQLANQSAPSNAPQNAPSSAVNGPSSVAIGNGPSNTPSAAPSGQGDIFDQLATGQTGTQTQTGTPAGQSQNQAPESALEQGFDTAGEMGGAAGFATGAVRDVAGTVSGLDNLVRRIPGISSLPRTEAERELQAVGQGGNTPEEITGKGIAGLEELLLGDEALKGLSVYERLSTAAKSAKAVEESPMLTRLVGAGLNALRGSTVMGTQSAVKTGDLQQATRAAIAGGALGAGTEFIPDAIDAAGNVINRVKRPFSLKAVQDTLAGAEDSIKQEASDAITKAQNAFHDSIRGLFSDTAKDAGVTPDAATSMRDVGQKTYEALDKKASDLYGQIDKAMGGTRFQTFDEQIGNVRRALRNSAGIDPDADGKLVERLNDLEDAKARALTDAEAKGVPPDTIKQANAAFRQARALEDLDKYLKQSTTGLRPDLAQPGTNAIPESVSPAKLATKAHRLYDTGRLQQAIGPDRADDLLRSVESTKQQMQDATQLAADKTKSAQEAATQGKANVRRNQQIAGTVGGLTGLGGLGTWVRHLLGE